MPKLATKLCARPPDKGSPCLRGLAGAELAGCFACRLMLISFACMSEKAAGETCLPFPEGDLFVAVEWSRPGPTWGARL